MCRMLAYSSDEPRDAGPWLAELSRLSRDGNLVARWKRHAGGNHPDGWGVAWRTDSGTRLARGGLPADADPAFAALRVVTDRFIGHARYASNPATVNAGNAHPFCVDGVVLAHNGTFKGAIGAEADARGVSDTLVFLERLVKEWTDRSLGGLRDVLGGLLSDRKLVGEYSAANFLIGAGRSLFARRGYRKHPDYYTLWLRAAPDEAAAASEPVGDPAAWRLLENGEVVELSARAAGP